MNEIKKLVELSEKAQPGPWKVADTYDAAYIMAPDIVDKRQNILAGLWPIHAERDTESAERITYATLEFIAALVNWFRANHESLESVRSEARHAALEEAARIAEPKSDNPESEWERGYWAAENVISKEIRALKENVHSTELRK